MKNLSGPFIIVSGPTGSGKSKLAFELCKKFNGEIISFDSLGFYRELSIGTARPPKSFLHAIPHHLIGHISLHHPWNAAQFSKEARIKMEEIQSRNHVPFLVGGSGFYLKALMTNMVEDQGKDHNIVRRSNELYQQKGIGPFSEILNRVDPLSFNTISEGDHYRIRRAVEYFWTNKSPFSDALKHSEDDSTQKSEGAGLHFYIDLPKDQLLKRIAIRTNLMLQAGLLEECFSFARLKNRPKPLGAVGYKQVFAMIDNAEKIDRKILYEKILIATRQLAKAQRTWFQKLSKIDLPCSEDLETCKQKISDYLQSMK